MALRIKTSRLARGWTAKDLAVNCAMWGAPEITAAVVANIETGRRGSDGVRRRDVSVDELLVLAYVLEISPSDLFKAADDDDDYVAMTRWMKIPVEDIAAWLRDEISTPVPLTVIPRGLARCGVCGEAVHAYMGEKSPIYRCMNPACDDPVNRPATYIDGYVSGLVFQHQAAIDAAAAKVHMSSPPPLDGVVLVTAGIEAEWDTLPLSGRQEIVRALLKRIVIQPETREDFEGTVRHVWSWEI